METVKERSRISLFSILSFVFIFLTMSGLSGQSKNIEIKGRVLDEGGKPIPYAAIVVEETNAGTMSNDDGYFLISSPDHSNAKLLISCVGFKDRVVSVTGKSMTITLEEDVNSLDEVVITEKSQTTRSKELPYAITAIDAKPLQVQNLDVNQVLNTTTGIRIREEGGMGSRFNFSLNGFSGNQVKFFLDGVPMDNFGSSLTLNNIPVNLISGIEVYKGVVPIYLGSDALGGAVNIITNQTIKNFADVSYSYGSFNTHRAAFIARYTNKKTGITVNANAFYNYSDNNYKMFIEVADILNNGTYTGEPEWITRFHDAYESKTAQLEMGMTDKTFADRLFLGVIVSENYKELQTGHNMNLVIGEAFDEDRVYVPTIKYKKSDFFIKGLDVSFSANFSMREALSADTSSRQYDWYQNDTIKNIRATSGEYSWYKTLFRYEDEAATALTHISYQISPVHSISFNNNLSTFTRIGEDPIARSKVPFSKPNTIKKNITGVAYNITLFENRFRTAFFAKLFLIESIGYEASVYSSDKETELPKVSVSNHYEGYGVASTYFITPTTQLKVSYENTYRLPEGTEMFGNGLKQQSNVFLRPEQSKNLNIGILSNNNMGNHHVVAEAQYIFRKAQDFIKLDAAGPSESNFENLSSVKGYGLEGGVKYDYRNSIHVEVNGTYQPLVYDNLLTPTGGQNFLYESQLANIPILFGNINMGYQFLDFIRKSNHLSLNWSTMYVDKFYLYPPKNGGRNPEEKNDIPGQISHSAYISYGLQNGRYNITFSCTNLSNAQVFDNFRLPKPGRAFSVKMRYYFSK